MGQLSKGNIDSDASRRNLWQFSFQKEKRVNQWLVLHPSPSPVSVVVFCCLPNLSDLYSSSLLITHLGVQEGDVQGHRNPLDVQEVYKNYILVHINTRFKLLD